MHTLERKVTPAFLMRFTLPTIIMMVFNSVYTMADGGFVSRFIGTNALSAVNIVYPALNLIFAAGIMLATGGSAVVAKQMGEGTPQKAKQSFSMILVCGVALGVVTSLAGILFTDPIVRLLGANDAIFTYGAEYTFYLSLFVPFAMLQVLFQYFFVTAGKPQYGLITTVFAGVTNIVLDYVFLGPLQMGIKGAAIATGIGFMIPAVFGLFYFAVNRKGLLCFVKPVFHVRTLAKVCANGSSEMVSNLSVAVTTFLFNLMMIQYLGADGVAAITIVLYAQFLFTAVFFGYTSGSAPLFSYNYGAENTKRLKALFRLSLFFIVACSIIAYVLSLIFSGAVVSVFASPGSRVFDLASQGMDIFAVGFLFMGFNIFASGLFTALSNGKVSALLSFLRTFVFILAAIFLLPNLFGVTGIWLSIPAAEFLALLVSLWYVIRKKKVYRYG